MAREWLECPECGEDVVESNEDGLFHEDTKVTIRTASDLLEAHIRQHGDASRVLTAISEALDATGMVSIRPTGSPSGGEAAGGPAA